jgi:hypothetical protein
VRCGIHLSLEWIPEVNRSLGEGGWRTSDDNIKIHDEEIGYEDVGWIYLTKDMAQWGRVV